MRLAAFRSNPSPLYRYGFAVGVSGIALALSLLFQNWFFRTPFLLFFPAVVLASAYGGLGPGLLATVLAIVLSDLFLLSPEAFPALAPSELARLIVFGAVAVFISLLYVARQRSEKRLAERLATLSSINELSETVNRTDSVEQIYQAALDALIRIGADRASILLFDEKGVMQFVAWRGLSDEYRAAATGHSPWTRESKSPQPVLVPDVDKDAELEALRPKIVGEGIHALAFIPLLSGEKLLGKFMVYYNAPHQFLPEQVQAAETIARHVAFGLERSRTDAELERSRSQLEVILHGITDGITVQEPGGKLIYANRAAAKLMGVDSPEEMLTLPPGAAVQRFQVRDEKGNEFPLAQLPGRLALQGQLPGEVLLRFYHKASGEERWSVVKAAPVFDAQGHVLLAVNMFRDFTERHRAEEAERDQRELLQVTLTSIGDAVIATDAEMRVTFMNRAAEHLTEWTMADARGAPLQAVFRIISEDTRQPVESPAVRVLAEGQVVGLANHTLLVTRTGKELPIGDSGAPIRDATGKVIGVVIAFRDVSLERRAQVELGRLAAIVESSDDSIYSKSLEGIVTSWNRGAERLYGYTAQEIVGQSVALITLDDHRAELAENLRRIRQGEAIPPYETVRRRKDGSTVAVIASLSPIRDQHGEVVGISTISRDITERKRAEAERAALFEQAERSRQRLAVLADASKILSSSLDYETTLRNVARSIVPQYADWCSVYIVQDGSPKLLEVAHQDPAKVALIYELQKRFPPNPNATSGVYHVIRTGQPEMTSRVDDELLVRVIKDPELLQIARDLNLQSGMTVPMIARDQVVGAIGFATAESGRLYTEEDLHLAEDLAQRAAVAIDNSRLFKQAEAAVQVRDQFLTLASHELKTPITSVMGFAELLTQRTANGNPLTERDHRALSLIYSQSVRLNQLILSMLDLSRIEAGQFSIEHAPVDLDALAEKTIDALQLNLERHTLTYRGPRAPLIVTGDELRLEQVLQNLVQNAIKYSPQGGTVEVTLERSNDEVCLAVTDRGIGIPEETIPALFNRFYRADNVVAQRISGMGIGLYVVKQIVTLHGGRVEVKSRVGDGSTFMVYLPLSGADSAQVQPALELAD